MKRVALVTIIFTIVACVDSATWDDLRVTWGPNPATYFKQQPRTLNDTLKLGFKRVGTVSSCDGSGVYNGVAYAKNNDDAVSLLFDKNGYIAGIQLGIPREIAEKAGYPGKKQQPPFVYVDGRYVLTAYFTDPSKICTQGRTEQEFLAQGTGTDLWIQTGNTSSDVALIPKKQSDLAKTKWTEGKCFVSMGKHYWYDVKPDMDCDSFLPVFLLYNGGKLNAFGWVMLAELPSSHYEHPGIQVIGAFMKQIPECVQKIQHPLSTMHIYLTSTPLLDAC